MIQPSVQCPALAWNVLQNGGGASGKCTEATGQPPPYGPTNHVHAQAQAHAAANNDEELAHAFINFVARKFEHCQENFSHTKLLEGRGRLDICDLKKLEKHFNPTRFIAGLGSGEWSRRELGSGGGEPPSPPP